MKKDFTKEVIQMTNKHVTRCQVSAVIGEMQTKPTNYKHNYKNEKKL